MKYAPEICLAVGVFVGVVTCRVGDKLFLSLHESPQQGLLHIDTRTPITNLVYTNDRFYTNVSILLGAITTTNVPPQSDPYDTTKFRVLTDGTRWKVQNNRGYRNTWQDDVWGGYFATEKEARDRVEDQRKFWHDIEADRATEKNFKEVK